MSDKLIAYLDTSALAKWYLVEANSDQVTDCIIGLDSAIISTLTKTEMRYLLARRKRMQAMAPELEAQIYATFLEDIAQGHLTLCQVEDKHLDSAAHLIDILPSHSLRTLDAMHLAIAQHNGIDRVATADNLFAKAAAALGFTVDSFGD